MHTIEAVAYTAYGDLQHEIFEVPDSVTERSEIIEYIESCYEVTIKKLMRQTNEE